LSKLASEQGICRLPVLLIQSQTTRTVSRCRRFRGGVPKVVLRVQTGMASSYIFSSISHTARVSTSVYAVMRSCVSSWGVSISHPRTPFTSKSGRYAWFEMFASRVWPNGELELQGLRSGWIQGRKRFSGDLVGMRVFRLPLSFVRISKQINRRRPFKRCWLQKHYFQHKTISIGRRKSEDSGVVKTPSRGISPWG
jgi:hypothetical protein